MRTRAKIRLDRLVAQPLALLLNGLARILGALWPRDRSVDPARVRVVVVAKFVGMGSIVQATPLLRALRARFPEAKLVLVTSRSNRALLPHLAEVDDALFVDDGGVLPLLWTTLRTLVELARRRVDLYFDLEIYSAYACVVALLGLARVRLGFYRNSASFKVGIYTHLVFFNTHCPVRQLYMQLGRAVGAEGEPGLPLSPLRVAEESRKRFEERWLHLAGPRAGRPHVVVNPNASDLLEERRWPAASFRAAIEELVRRGHAVALTGSEAERDYVRGLVEALPPQTREGVTDTAGRLPLDEFLVLLERAACVLTNDSGPMHMAVAQGRPTVCLFGPCDPDHYGMPGPRVAVLYHRVICSPCVHHTEDPPCAGDNVCMKRIAPAEVLAAVERVTGAAGAGAEAGPASVAAPSLDFLDSAGGPLGLVVRRRT